MAEKGELPSDVQAHLIACFMRDFGPYVSEPRQRDIIDYIWTRGLGIKGIHGSLLTEARRRLAGIGFAKPAEKLAYLRALLILYPERDVQDLINGPVRHVFGGSMHGQSVRETVEEVRRMKLTAEDITGVLGNETVAAARALVKRIEACKPHDEPGLL